MLVIIYILLLNSLLFYLVALALSLGGIYITLVLDQSAMMIINSINKNELVICNENLDDESRSNHNEHNHSFEHCVLEKSYNSING